MADITQQLTEEREKLQSSLDKLSIMLEGKEIPLSINNPDGTVNYTNLISLLKDPNYSEFRANNPDVVRQSRINMGVELGGRFLKGAFDIGKLGFSLSQIGDAKRVDDSEPSFPKRPARNLNLQRAISDSSRAVSQGLSDSERASIAERRERSLEGARRRLLASSGGQSSAVQAGNQILADTEARQNLNEAALSEDVRRKSRVNLSRLINSQLGEDARIQQHGLNKFRYRDMPVYQNRVAAKERLMKAGLTNAFRSGDALLRDAVSAGRLFNGRVPGTISPNSYYSNDSHPLNDVFNNGANGLDHSLGVWGNPGVEQFDRLPVNPINNMDTDILQSRIDYDRPVWGRSNPKADNFIDLTN